MSATPMSAQAGSSSDNLLDLAAHGGPAVGLGFGVSPLHWNLIAPPDAGSGATAVDGRLLDNLEPRGKAVSFDLKLRWPTAADLPVEPYVVLGPALFVDRPHELSGLTGIPSDPVLRVGAKAGAGFNWRLSREATLFGSYDITTTTGEGFTSGTKAPATGSPSAYDVMYGVRFRY